MRPAGGDPGAGPSYEQQVYDDQPSTSAPNGTADGTERTSHDGDDLYIKHTVNKLDTLAGLAIKYNVSVSDIKRINGLLTDSAMYARGTLLIPKESLHLGQEYSAWAAMIITRHGRVSTEGKGGLLAIEAPTQSNQAIEQLKRYYNINQSPPRGTNGGAFGHDYRRSRSEQSLLEMSSMDTLLNASHRSSDDLRRAAGPPPPAVLLRDSNAADDRVRRRRVGEGSDGLEGLGGWGEGDEASGGTVTITANPRTGKPQYGRPPSGLGNASGSGGNNTPRESILQKVKRVASNPVIANSAAQLTNAAGSLKKMLTAERAPAAQPPPPPMRPASKKD